MAASSLLEPTSSVLLSAHSMQAEQIPRAIRRAYRRCAYDCGLLQRPPTSCIADIAVIGLQSSSFRYFAPTIEYIYSSAESCSLRLQKCRKSCQGCVAAV